VNNQHKPYSKFREREEEFKLSINFKAWMPYIYVLAMFLAAVLIILVIFNIFLMPAMVHDRHTVKVPNVLGMDLSQTTQILQNSKLNIKVSNQQYSENSAPDIVLKQSPEAEDIVKENRTIYITVSKGKETVAMPMLIGLPVRLARLILMKQGLELGNVLYDYSDFIAKDTIAAQSINVGSKVPFGKVIDVTVSRGSNSQTIVPVLVGNQYNEIEFLLSQTGFLLGNITFKHSETFTPNTIIEQSPAQGELAPNGSKIDIVVSSK
jgi:serine/threonine-protein kinase